MRKNIQMRNPDPASKFLIKKLYEENHHVRTDWKSVAIQLVQSGGLVHFGPLLELHEISIPLGMGEAFYLL